LLQAVAVDSRCRSSLVCQQQSQQQDQANRQPRQQLLKRYSLFENQQLHQYHADASNLPGNGNSSSHQPPHKLSQHQRQQQPWQSTADSLGRLQHGNRSHASQATRPTSTYDRSSTSSSFFTTTSNSGSSSSSCIEFPAAPGESADLSESAYAGGVGGADEGAGDHPQLSSFLEQYSRTVDELHHMGVSRDLAGLAKLFDPAAVLAGGGGG
jgi:hypothetical protein